MCTTKLCSLLEQRQRLSSLLSDTALDPGPALHQAKRAPGMEFVGKRAPGMEFVGKRAPGMEFVGKRAPGMEFVGKRSPGMEFVGKRSPGMEFLGKRSPLPLHSKRAPGKSSLLTLVHLEIPIFIVVVSGMEFLGKRSAPVTSHDSYNDAVEVYPYDPEVF